MVVVVVLGFVLAALGALVARRAGSWRVAGAVVALAGLALVVYELVFCDC